MPISDTPIREETAVTRTTARFGRWGGALVAGALVLAGCADNTSATDRASTMSGGESSTASADPQADFNDADVDFAQGMIPHHRQAIEMARLAQDRAEDPRVLDLAERIEAAQEPEIETLSGWLEAWGAEATGGMDHGSGDGMGGKMSEQDMAALMNATGPEFDRLFLEQMIVHHDGAVAMAVTEAGEGRFPDAVAMAEQIRDTQSAEIAEMRQLLTDLGG